MSTCTRRGQGVLEALQFTLATAMVRAPDGQDFLNYNKRRGKRKGD